MSLPRGAFLLSVAAAYGLVLYLNLPGHLSVDSVLALREGRLGVRETWNPALFGWLLGVFDRMVRGTGLYLAAMALVLFAAWGALLRLRPAAHWAAPAVVLGAALLPQVAIYQGIVWKDVAFANCAVAGFVCLALGVRERLRWPWLAIAALLFAAAGLFRQNGLLVLLPAAVALGWSAAGRRLPARVALAAGWTAAVAALTLALSVLAQPQGVGSPDRAGAQGVRVLQAYDVIAAVARDPDRPLPHIDALHPAADDYIREAAGRVYSPERVDTLNLDETLNGHLRPIPTPVIGAEWRDIVTRDPGLYLRARFQAFRWVLATPVIDRCLPVHVGAGGPPEAMRALRMPARFDDGDRRLYNYATWFFDTPAMSHLAYAAVALAVGVLLLLRRGPGDIPMAGLMAAALLFTASFFAISIACDYRYLYFLDLSAITGVIYLALDPRLRRRDA